MPAIAINIDVGELEDEPEEFYFLATYVNIACGAHAGDKTSMERAVRYAQKHGAFIAAHPSYPDREHFGRRALPLSGEALFESIYAQCRLLDQIARASGGIVCALKPHGALYHEAGTKPDIAATLLGAARQSLGDNFIALIAQPDSLLLGLASKEGHPLKCLREGFADRGYMPNGKLIPRGSPGAALPDPQACAEQALHLARSGQFDTICLHSDTPGALENARAVRGALEQYNFIEPKIGRIYSS